MGSFMAFEAVCIGSGPSLCVEDVEVVRCWRMADDDRWVVVVNSTFREALWSDWLFAMDSRWWKVYVDEAKRDFKGSLITSSHCYRTYNIEFSRHTTFGNSGAGAVHLAFHRGARRIVLLGYDCQRTNGKAHHYGDHPAPLANATSCAQWPGQFQRLADALRGKVEIVNASRETALTCFPKMKLEDVLASSAEAA